MVEMDGGGDEVVANDVQKTVEIKSK